MSLPEWQILSEPTLNTLPFQDTVLDHPPVNTRASLYIYLNAHLHNLPSIDDASLLTFLNIRYNENISELVSDLILATFDALANATNRSAPQRFITTIRSFLSNKLPVFLHDHYAALIFEPTTIEQCIRQALGRIDPSAFPSFSQMFDFSSSPGSSTLSEARQEFLFACALHGLIPEQSIEDILGDVPMQSLPAGGRYSKDDLVNQCRAAPAKIEQFVGELENMEGNAGEVVAALTEILQALCASHETATLKGVCNTLSRKLASLDVIMLFTTPRELLLPLVNLLDGWPDQDDQGEYQPVYDEFGSLLLFVAGVKHQFHLSWEDMGIDSPDSFVQVYFKTSSASRLLTELSDHESEILGAWIKGLFETGAITDELMSTCKPKEFHLLVATLFDQSLKATQSGALPLDTLKSGFEYLLEPFLLPSLVAGLTWFADRLCENSEQQVLSIDTLLPALHALLKPASISSDASTLHTSVLVLVAKPLKDALTLIQKTHPHRPDVAPLLHLLTPLYDDRPALTALKELQSWSTTPHGGLATSLNNSLSTLILWSATSASASSTDMSPPAYSHTQLSSAIAFLGAKPVLDLFLRELTSATAQQPTHPPQLPQTSEPILLDILASMIVATFPTLNTSSSNAVVGRTLKMTLHTALLLEYQFAAALSTVDLARATAVVRLYRRVEALLGRKEVDLAVNGATGAEGEVGMGVGDGVVEGDIDDVLAAATAGAGGGSGKEDFVMVEGGVEELMGMA